jgi:hypothetical protein
MFESRDWFKELLIILALYIGIATAINIIVPSFLSVPISVGLVMLVIYRIHRKASKRVWKT